MIKVIAYSFWTYPQEFDCEGMTEDAIVFLMAELKSQQYLVEIVDTVSEEE